MAFSQPSRPAPFGAISIYRIVRAIEDALMALRRRDPYEGLSDRMLADVGLSRQARMAQRYSIYAARNL